MNLEVAEKFFMYCTIINACVITVWAVCYMFFPDPLYRSQKKWFDISREQFNVVFYSLLGLFKIMFIIFNLTPYIALRILVK